MRLQFQLAVAAALLNAATLRGDLIGYWPLDGDANDRSSSGIHGTMEGDIEFVDDVPEALGSGMSVRLNPEGVVDPGFIDLGNPEILNFSDNDWAITAWMKVPELLPDRGNIFSKGGDNAGGVRYVLAYLENSGTSIVLTTDDNVTKRQAEADLTWFVDDEQWHHVVGLRAGTELQVYVDGELAAENLDLPDGYDLSGVEQKNAYIGVGIGQDTNAFEKSFQGWIDDVAIFNEALSEDQIARIMAGDFSEWDLGGVIGDFDGNGMLDAGDLDDLTSQSAAVTHPAAYDLNSDSLVDAADIGVWVKDHFGSWIGDANLDGQFNSSDLVSVLASGTYEADVDSVWSTGDFNGDGRTNSGDLVAALADGGYEAGAAAAMAAVPEPSGLLPIVVGMACLLGRRRH
jgi:hypothetical protein